MKLYTGGAFCTRYWQKQGGSHSRFEKGVTFCVTPRLIGACLLNSIEGRLAPPVLGIASQRSPSSGRFDVLEFVRVYQRPGLPE